MSPTYTTFFRERLLGVTRRAALPADHLAFFCPGCGDVWARCVLSTPARWYAVQSPCDLCGMGSLWLRWMPEHNAALPTVALEREFLLAVEDTERWIFAAWDLPLRPRFSPSESPEIAPYETHPH